uniref:ATP synthase complex subunit 8 n=1 Tax=Fejervarya cancrivora TaxID=111367 RepID=C3RXV5_FEJCA|nr:ATP synthase F0 subunit 8 [Fejervarya cancrivora]ACD49887.1 ATP synthase F0 subunit 8 [Fejervarya cancrivora]
MPQLLPDPWFTIFIFTWAIFIIAAPMKIASYEFPKDPTPIAPKTLPSPAWTWKW